ncbi:TniB family NTP-binding protein [Vibrio vulnificus]|uniref:TniB family NTP-binding protein n=1 Tax=Vibrio vulnificus TaxID=672 RepID=UPI001CDB62B1|nr:TniB family NTP-binding protein [Vibrio vulnificus]
MLKSDFVQPVEDMLEAYHESFSIYPEVENVFAGLDWILKRRKFGTFAPSMLLIGGTGAGKSALIRYYIEHNLSGGEALITRVRPTLRETLIWLIKELNVYKNPRSKASEIGLTDYVISSIKKAKLKLLVIEESQELFECTTHRERQEIRDRLKMISDDCRIPIVFVGLPSVCLILEDSQWDRRIMVKRELPYVQILDKASIVRYQQLLQALKHSIPLPLDVELTDVDFAMRLLAATRGMVGMFKEIIAAALESALIAQQSTINIVNFVEGYESFNGPCKSNPFSVEIENLIVEQIESYEKYIADADTGELKFVGQMFKKLSIKQLLG